MAQITWSETTVTVNVGGTATVNFTYGKELELMFTITTSDASVATIATSGNPSAFTGVATITGVSAGTTVTVPGGSDTQNAPLAITVVEADDEEYLNKRGLTHFWDNIDTLKQDKLGAGDVTSSMINWSAMKYNFTGTTDANGFVPVPNSIVKPSTGFIIGARCTDKMMFTEIFSDTQDSGRFTIQCNTWDHAHYMNTSVTLDILYVLVS